MPAKILVIDDNATNLDLMVYLLRTFGHEATGANVAQAGLEAAQSGNYDLILSDILMPGLDGFELARRMKASSTTRQTPLVAVTAMAMVGDRDRVLAAGFDGYITKPIDPQTFLPQVDAFLPEAKRVPLPQRKPASPVQPREKQSTGPVILAVDDVQVNLDVIHGALEPFGYRIIGARSVSDALVKMNEVKPALILCDVHMPERDGYDLIASVRGIPALKMVPFIFLSSTAWNPVERSRGLELGATSFLTRPIDPSTLAAAVQRALAP